MLAGTMARKLVAWRWRLVLGAGTSLLFLLPLTGFSQLFTPQQEAQLQAATDPGFTPGQRAFLDLLQQANERYWLKHERVEIARFQRAFPNLVGTAAFRRYVRTERLERQRLFLELLALRQASPFRVAFFLDDDPGDLFEGNGF